MRVFRSRQEALAHVGHWWNRVPPEEKAEILGDLPDIPWADTVYQDARQRRIVAAWTRADQTCRRAARLAETCAGCGGPISSGDA